MNREQYIELSNQLLNDTNFYLQLKRDPTSTYQQKANKLISELKSKKLIDDNQAHSLRIYNHITPKFYGQPKIHKPMLSLRPIISSIDAPNSKLASFLSKILTNAYNVNNPYYVPDSFTFAEEFQNFQLPNNFILVSFDVISLFTNIPLDLIKTIIEKNWTTISNYTNIPLNEFLNILKLIFDTTYCLFNGSYYKQIKGTPMGSILSPILAQYVMDDLIENCKTKLNFQFPFIKKYVDDIICSIPNNYIQETLNIFNNYNRHIQFTIEEETNNSVPFLDTKLIRLPDNKIMIDWYIKPTSSQQYINYYSQHSIKIKTNLILTQKLRIQKISHPSLIKNNLKKLFTIFQNNSYPDHI